MVSNAAEDYSRERRAADAYYDEDPLAIERAARMEAALDTTSMMERRRQPSAWLDPRFLLPAFLAVAALIAAGAVLQVQSAKIESAVDRIESAVNIHTGDIRELRRDLVAIEREIKRVSDAQTTLGDTSNAWVQQMNKDIARLQVQVGR